MGWSTNFRAFFGAAPSSAHHLGPMIGAPDLQVEVEAPMVT